MCGSGLLRAGDVAKLLNVSAKAVYRWAASGRLPAVRLSEKVIRFELEAVEAFVARGRVA
jgi:excisionase family DNA binding protein